MRWVAGVLSGSWWDGDLGQNLKNKFATYLKESGIQDGDVLLENLDADSKKELVSLLLWAFIQEEGENGKKYRTALFQVVDSKVKDYPGARFILKKNEKDIETARKQLSALQA